ncbi:hypothetical protein EFL96_12635 [Lactococcus lactis]|uniref:ERF family protein n=1 Tax=Lactococcus lactis TaxID=1358 RepID=UPI00223B8242|nr:ERF family protein [Lactococcus lactis]MCT1186595.1 hypothetical protein [Lactococcus lactis]MCT1190725.1 hypothetical protein [Lactococcus lactis]
MEKEKMTFSELQREMQIGKSKSVKNYSGQTSYNYRNAEQIYEHFKSLDSGWILIVSDKMHEILGRLFVESTATVSNSSEEHTAVGYSEHDQVPIFEKSGKQQMQKPQWTGAVSSYARKYALQGLFAIGENDVDDLQSENLNDTPKASEKDDEEDKTPQPQLSDAELIEKYLKQNPENKPNVDEFLKTKSEHEVAEMMKAYIDWSK